MLLTLPISSNGAVAHDLLHDGASGLAMDAWTDASAEPRIGFISKRAFPASKSEEPITEKEGDSSKTAELVFSPNTGRANVGATSGSSGSQAVGTAAVWGTAPNTPAVNAFPPAFGRSAVVPPALAVGASARPPAASQVKDAHAVERYGNLPLTFEANHGQTDARVDFIARTGGGTVYLTPTAAVFSIQSSAPSPSGGREPAELGKSQGAYAPRSEGNTIGAAIHMQIVGANPNAEPTGVNLQPGIVNYFIGNDPSQWRSNIPTFGGVQYDDVYPGIDLVYYGNNGQLEYDFIVTPGADPAQIAVNFAGADSVEINPQGDLVLHTAAGDIVQQKPLTYQEVGGTRHEVSSGYVVDGTQVRFEVGAYDTSRALVIDPLVLGYSTYLGGSDFDDSFAITVDQSGSAYVTGWTSSADFPTTPGAFDQIFDGPIIDGYAYQDAFVTKLNATGTAVVFSTFLGGSGGQDGLTGIAVDGIGNAYVTGVTTSYDYPTTPGAFGTLFNGDIDAVVTKLRADGAGLLYSTFLGASDGYDFGQAIAVDGNGNAYVVGDTTAPSFPTTPGAFDTTHAGNEDAFVTKLNASGTALAYSTFLGGSSFDYALGIAVGSNGDAFVTGYTSSSGFPTTPGAFDTNLESTDAFITKLKADGTGLHYSTFLGAAGGESAYGIAVDGNGSAYIVGSASSSSFPTTPGAFDTSFNGSEDAFVTKVRGDGSGLLYSTFLGGAIHDGGYAIAVDKKGSAYVTGYTRSSDFPITPGAFDSTHNGGSHDVFLTKLNAGGSALAYSTYLGGSDVENGYGIAVDGGGNAYVTGTTQSSSFPTNLGTFDTTFGGESDGFVTKFCERACRVPVIAKPRVP